MTDRRALALVLLVLLVLMAMLAVSAVTADPAASSGRGWSRRQLQVIVRKQFAPAGRWAVRRAFCIVGRESQWKWWAISPTSDYGLFQINVIHRRVFDWGRILEPRYNAAAAWSLSRHGRDFSPWNGGRWPC